MTVIEHLSEAECWTLLSSESFGRIAVATADGPDIFPVNYVAHEGALYFRSAPGTKLIEVASDGRVAFEVDGRFGDAKSPGRHWSVVVRGTAARLDSDADIEASGVEFLVTAAGGEQYNYVRITPTAVTGRRL
jgi:nitroimidazol reductase NimA-like FMN-containing flavoprotein (pyridoxamine 5'-phosphate oxidase superfamily)